MLIAEDSPTVREMLREILSSDADVEVVGDARNGREAVEKTMALRPDVVTMDIRMPLLDGFEATRQIMVDAPTPIVIVSGHYSVRDVETSFQALRLGALAILATPAGPLSPGFEEESRELIETVKAMANVKVVRRFSERNRARPAPAIEPKRFRLAAVAASTGGPAALQQIFRDLPEGFPVPVLVVQHIASGFVPGLASWLNGTSKLVVKIAEDGEPLQPGHAYLAPDDHHLGVTKGLRAVVSQGDRVGGFRPSADAMFESAAAAAGSDLLALILTGMGSDGIDGLVAVRKAGGRVISQDVETSVVPGMPGSAIARNIPHHVVPLDQMARCITEMISKESIDAQSSRC